MMSLSVPHGLRTSFPARARVIPRARTHGTPGLAVCVVANNKPAEDSATGYRLKKGEGNTQKERVFKSSQPEPKASASSGFGVGGSSGFGGGGGSKKSKGSKGGGKKAGVKKGARVNDVDYIRQADKEYDALCADQAKNNLAFLEYVVSVRAASGKTENQGMLSDWLPVCQLMVLLDDDEVEAGDTTYSSSPHMESVVGCAINQRKATIAAMARAAAKNDAKGLLEFAYEPETSFRQALNAIAGMESSEEDSAFVTLGLSPGATPSDIRKAYRTVAARWHPDKYTNASPELQAEAEAKFTQAKTAHETLNGSRIQKGQGFKDLGGNDRTGFTELVAFDEVGCAASDRDLAGKRAGLIQLDQGMAVTPFAVRNMRHARRAAAATANA